MTRRKTGMAWRLGLLGVFFSACRPSAPTLEDARLFSDSQPRYLRALPYSEVPEGLADLRSATCGACHAEIYAEWRVSTHARAYFDDAQFLAELEKSRSPGADGAPFDVGWMCLNCHTPMENQLPKLVVALEGGWHRPKYLENPRFDPKLADDAIGCATCHVRDGVVLGPFGDTKAPHPVRKDPSLATTEVCTQCHQAVAEFAEIRLACSFDTGREHLQSPYADQTCQSCHMLEVERKLSILPDSPVRKTRSHGFGGSMIPKRPELAGELPKFPDGAELRWVGTSTVHAGPNELWFEVENANAGHLLPTGDPERFLLIRAEVRGGDGALLAAREERIGQLYEWWPKVRKLSDNRLAPKERRGFSVTFQAPRKGRISLRLLGSKWRISEENVRLHDLEGKYVAGRTFFDQALSIELDVSSSTVLDSSRGP